jgi:hypothetical protein
LEEAKDVMGRLATHYLYVYVCVCVCVRACTRAYVHAHLILCYGC